MKLCERGSALLSAMFIMTLVAIATMTLTLELRYHIAETDLVFSASERLNAATVARLTASEALLNDKYKTFGRELNAKPIKLKAFQMNALPNITLSLEIQDLSQKFNINEMYQPPFKTAFYLLTKHLAEDGSGKSSFALTQEVANWVTESRARASQHDNQVIAHTPLVSMSELSFIKKLSPETLALLKPYVTLLPKGAQLNINTISEDILMSFAQGDEATKAVDNIVNMREEKPIESLDAIQSEIKKLNIKTHMLTTESQYFLAISTLSTKNQTLTLYSLLERVKNNKDNTYEVRLIQETWHAQ